MNTNFGMKEEILNEVRRVFPDPEEEIVLKHLNSITLEHVMAGSQTNLDNTWSAIIKLSHGNLPELIRLTECAKNDFRDVIYWASVE